VITLYQAGTSGYGSTPITLGTAVSGSGGAFVVGFTPPSSPALLYLVASGGDAGAGANPAIKLMATLGMSNHPPSGLVTVNEVTTVASLWGLAQFSESAQAANIGAPAGNLMGLANASYLVLTNLVNVATGAAGGSNPPAGSVVPITKLNTLANLLAACVGSTGADSAQCSGLFSAATPDGGASAADTLAAALDVALNPGNNVGGLFTIANGSSAYAPSLGAAPNDWTMAVNYSDDGLGEPTAAAIDESGDVWIANIAPDVVKLDPAGNPLSPTGGFTGGGLEESFSIAIGSGSSVWITNQQSPGDVNAGLGTVTKLASDGTVLSGASGFAGGGLDFPEAIAIDSTGSAWVANFGSSSVTKLTSAGTPLSPEDGFKGGGLNFPIAVAIDPLNDAWIANQSNNSVTELDSTGKPVSESGFTGGGLDLPQAIAIDGKRNVWVANFSGASISEFNAAGTALSPRSGFGGGGLDSPGGVAVDGAGHIWITNYHGNSLSELAGVGSSTPGMPLTPATGYVDSSLSEPFGPAIDASGDIWTANFGNNSVTEFVGLATPHQ
jgi:hypothetical protein